MSPELDNKLKSTLTDLITTLHCPICRKLVSDPTVAQCGHVACKSCWSTSTKCHSCKLKITDKENFAPNNYIDQIKEAVQLILNNVQEEYGVSVDVNSSSPESSCDWFYKAPKENPKKYVNRKRPSIADSDKLLSISQANSPLVFAGENIDDTFNSLKPGNISALDKKESAEKVKNWLKTSENEFVQPVDDISSMNIDTTLSVKSPLKKKLKLMKSKLTKNVNDSVSEISSCASEPVNNDIPLSKSLINDIIGVPEEKLNKDTSWESVKKMKKVLKKSKTTRKLKINTDVSKKSSKDSLEIRNTSKDSVDSKIDTQQSPHKITADVSKISSKESTHDISKDACENPEIVTNEICPVLPIDADKPQQNIQHAHVANISSQSAKATFEDVVEICDIEIDEVIHDSSTYKQPKYTYSKINKPITTEEEPKCFSPKVDNNENCFSKQNLIDLPSAQEHNVLEVNNDTFLSVSPCGIQQPKVPFIFKGLLPKKPINSKPHKVDFFYKSRCGTKENSENLQDGLNITISSDSMITSISIRNQPLENVSKLKNQNIRICNVRDAQTSPIPTITNESNVFFNENQELCISTSNKNINSNDNEARHEISKIKLHSKNVKPVEDHCAMDDLDILFSSSPMEIDEATTLSREPSKVLLSKRTFERKSQESQNNEESNTQLSKEISQLDIIPNTEFVPKMINRMKIDRNVNNKANEQLSKMSQISGSSVSKPLSQNELDKTDVQLMSMEIDNELRSSGNIFTKSVTSNELLENKEKSFDQNFVQKSDSDIIPQSSNVKTIHEKTLELLPEEEILLTPCITVSQSKATNPNLGNLDVSDADIVENTPQKPRKIGMRKQDEMTKSQSQMSSPALVGNEILNKDNTMFVDLNTEAFLVERHGPAVNKEQTSSSKTCAKNETPLSVKSFEESVKHRSTPFDDVRARRSLDYNKMSKIEEDFENSQSNEISLGSTSHTKTMIEKEFLEQALNASDTTLKPSTHNLKMKEKNELLQQISHKTSERKISVACSLLSATKVQAVKKFIKSIGGEFCDTYEKKLTHLIVSVDENNTCQRSVKYIRSLAAGIWILSYEWVVDCVKSNSILNEEKYEVLDSSGEEGPKINRAGKSKLFQNFTFYCMPPFSLLSEQVLADILESAGGKVVKTVEEIYIKNPKQLHILLGEPEDTQEQRFLVMCLKHPIVPVNLEWALGSLGEGRTDGAAAWFLAPKRLLPTIDWPDNLMEDDSSDD